MLILCCLIWILAFVRDLREIPIYGKFIFATNVYIFRSDAFFAKLTRLAKQHQSYYQKMSFSLLIFSNNGNLTNIDNRRHCAQFNVQIVSPIQRRRAAITSYNVHVH